MKHKMALLISLFSRLRMVTGFTMGNDIIKEAKHNGANSKYEESVSITTTAKNTTPSCYMVEGSSGDSIQNPSPASRRRFQL